jgi:hypothetical protein
VKLMQSHQPMAFQSGNKQKYIKRRNKVRHFVLMNQMLSKFSLTVEIIQTQKHNK